jgi:hypothetical protein
LELELTAVATAGKGQRNGVLNRAAFSLGRFIGSGDLLEGDVTDALLGCAIAAGLHQKEAAATIASGLRAAVRRAA